MIFKIRDSYDNENARPALIAVGGFYYYGKESCGGGVTG